MKWFFVLMVCCHALMCSVNSAQAMADGGFMQGTLVGNKPQDFTLQTVRGSRVHLAETIAGKRAILFFWATWCPHCRQALKDMNLKREELESKGIVFVPVSIGEAPETVDRYLKQHGYSFDVVLDPEQSLGEAYQIVGVPTMIYINEQGVITSVSHMFENGYENNF